MEIKGETLKRAIKASGLTIQEAADRLKISRQALHSQMTRAVLAKGTIGRVMDVLKIDLASFDEGANPNSEILKRLCQIEKRADQIDADLALIKKLLSRI